MRYKKAPHRCDAELSRKHSPLIYIMIVFFKNIKIQRQAQKTKHDRGAFTQYTPPDRGENQGVLRNCIWRKTKFFFRPVIIDGGSYYLVQSWQLVYNNYVEICQKHENCPTRPERKNTTAAGVTPFSQAATPRPEATHLCFASLYFSRAVSFLMGNAAHRKIADRMLPAAAM